MKSLKLILTFLGVLAVAVGILFLANIEIGKKTKVFVPQSEIKLATADIEGTWEDVSGWDSRVFADNCALVKQMAKAYPDDATAIANLSDRNCNLALERIQPAMINQWAKADCDRSMIKKFKAALDTVVAADRHFSQVAVVKDLTAIHGVYERAVRRAEAVVACGVKFNGETGTWNSFEAYARSVRGDRDAILHNQHYTQYLSNITAIKTGLNSIDSRLSTARTNFYSGLCSSILNFYRQIPQTERTMEQLTVLRNAKSHFLSEYQGGGYERSLSELDKQFTKDVRNNSMPQPALQGR